MRKIMFEATPSIIPPRLRFGVYFLVAILVVNGLPLPKLAQASGVPETFEANRIIENDSFISPDSMGVADIQSFLNTYGSGLANYSDGGRTAAEIIWGAAHGQGNASGTVTGTSIMVVSQINPKVILTTLQKEQSLVTNPSPSQSDLDYAMGYGCPDSGGCSDSYRGFTKQVETAAWQLQWNYQRATLAYADYQVGQTMTFSNSTSPYNPPATQQVTIGNSATAALYRYTPHAYNGNYNFWKLYRQWFNRLAAQIVSRNRNPVITQGQAGQFEVRLKNTGEETWTPATIRLGTARGFDRIPAFIREDRVGGSASGWLSANRVSLVESSVAPGQTGTFRFYYSAPETMPPGIYREYFVPVADGVGWFDDPDLSWDIMVATPEESFQAVLASRSANLTLAPGSSGILEVSLRNTGYSTWQRGVVNLGTDRVRDRIPAFIREDRVSGSPSGWLSANRVSLVESSVAPGQTGTFRFAYTVPPDMAVGVYREYFRPVIESRTWLPDPIFDLSWDITVTPPTEPRFDIQWQGQNIYPTLHHGESYLFEVQLQNTGTTTWQRGIVNLGTDRARDRIPAFIREDRVGGLSSGWLSANRVSLVETSVAPGQTGTFRFAYTVPTDLAAGVYREYFRPVADGIDWLADYGIFWDIQVIN